MQHLIYSAFASLLPCVCVVLCERAHKCLYMYVSIYCTWAAKWIQQCSILFFSPLPFCVCDHRRWMSGRVSWEDFCCMVAPSHCAISNSPGSERPGIWRDHPRLAHKSLPWGLRQNSDIITLRPSGLWCGWRCSSATVLFSADVSWQRTLLRHIPPKSARVL